MPRPPNKRGSFAQDRATLMRIARALLGGNDEILSEWRVEAFKLISQAVQVMAEGEVQERQERKAI